MPKLAYELECERCRRGHWQKDGHACDGRPQFKCDYCKQIMTCGHHGGRVGELLGHTEKLEADRGRVS